MTDHYLVIDIDGELMLRCNAKPTLREFAECWYAYEEETGDIPMDQCNATLWFCEGGYFVEKPIRIPVEIGWDEGALVLFEVPADGTKQ